jgi:hypothetical protein
VIELDDLPGTVRGDYSAALGPSLRRNDSMRAWGSRYARLVLERSGGNKRAACRALGISYHTLQAYLRFPLEDPGEESVSAWPDASAPAVNQEDEPLACRAGER